MPTAQGALARFAPAVRAWFREALGAPTPVQERTWEAVAAGRNVLSIAPTGSGKTLAAFLFAIDRLMAQKARALERGDALAPGVRVLYVSPLKALGADVERNLARPLAAIAERLAGEGGAPEVRVGMRTGDTPAAERRTLQRKPPDILITTPESLYLMLTSQARETLRTVESVIVDEVHSVAGSKRGAHLSLSLERLDLLLGQPAQRIGLSATVRPPELVARFLGGALPVEVVEAPGDPALDLEVRVPVEDMTAIPAFGGLPGGEAPASQGTRGGAPRGPRRAPAEQAWKSDRAMRALMAGGSPQAKGAPDSRIGSASIWPYLEAAILDEVLAHRSTIAFVNSRGLCERLTARLNELYGRRTGSQGAVAEMPDGTAPGAPLRSSLGATTELAQGAPVAIAKAHHGSVSKERRLAVERELKAGELPCVVATSSLELGIDMGEVDLVLQVAPPLSVASGLQRIGRANHQVGGRSQGIIFPRTRVELAAAAVMAEGMLEGAIEPTSLVRNALDVLAQQTVAAVAMAPEGLSCPEWLEVVRRSACYACLSQAAFDSVVEMLSGRFASGDLADFAPRLQVVPGADGPVLKPLPRTQRLAVTGAGTIPDRGLYPVMLPTGDGRSGRRRVGELDEEMVHESRVGDVIALGTSTWRITEITGDRVLVEPAPGRQARLPFWHGEGVGRGMEAGRRHGAFLREATAALEPRDGVASGQGERASREAEGPSFAAPMAERLRRDGLDGRAQRNLARLLEAQRQATGAVPSDVELVAERCADESGDWRLIVHSPYGRRVHEPWALAISQRIRSELGYDPQALAADDGILLRIPLAAERIPGADLLAFDPDEAEALVRAAVGSTALFAGRFRECAARALLMTPTAPGKRAPLWQQRVRGGQLLEAARAEGDFPLLAEAARECLQDVYDLEGLRRLMGDLKEGRVRLREAETLAPSPFAGPLAFGYVAEHLYEGDLPHAEQRAALLGVDEALLGELLGTPDAAALVDARAMEQVEAELQRTAPGHRLRGAEGAAQLLRSLGPLALEEVAARLAGSQEAAGEDGVGAKGEEAGVGIEDARAWLCGLEAQQRAFRVALGGQERWAHADDARRLQAAAGAAVPSWALEAAAALGGERGFGATGGAVDGLVGRYARTHGPFSAEEAARALGIGPAIVEEALARLQAVGSVTLGNFPRPGAEGPLWADREVLARLRRRSRALARADVEPVEPAAYQRFVLERQGIGPDGPAAHGAEGLGEVIAQHEGAYLPARAWEEVVFPARVAAYQPSLLDELIGAGEVLWAARAPEGEPGEGPRAQADALEGFEVALFPTDSPLAPARVDLDAEPWELEVAEPAPQPSGAPSLEQLVERVLGLAGPLGAASLAEEVARRFPEADATRQDVERALAALVARGRATCDGFGAVRAAAKGPAQALRSAAPTSRRSRSRRSSARYRSLAAEAKREARERVVARSAQAGALAGRWQLLEPPLASSTLQALGAVESLLDRYGLVTRDLALLAGVQGGLAGLYPVLRRLEDAGELVRGEFVAGMGPSQFASPDAVDGLRQLACAPASPDSRRATVLAADDPASLAGAALPWPPAALPAPAPGGAPGGAAAPASSARPARRQGALVVLVEGNPALYAGPSLRALVSFCEDPADLALAVRALVAHVEAAIRREGPSAARRKLVVETANGAPVLDTPLAAPLQEAGLVRDANGLRLYVSPF